MTLAATESATPTPQLTGDAVDDFNDRLQAYMRLRTELARGLKTTTTTPSPDELDTRRARLAAAVRKARASAQRGDLIPPGVASLIVQAIFEDAKNRGAENERAAIGEVLRARRPSVNSPYPPGQAFSTVPAFLLMSLPPLPDTLQYRFYGRHLVLLDTEAQLILDYVANALPPL